MAHSRKAQKEPDHSLVIYSNCGSRVVGNWDARGIPAPIPEIDHCHGVISDKEIICTQTLPSNNTPDIELKSTRKPPPSSIYKAKQCNAQRHLSMVNPIQFDTEKVSNLDLRNIINNKLSTSANSDHRRQTSSYKRFKLGKLTPTGWESGAGIMMPAKSGDKTFASTYLFGRVRLNVSCNHVRPKTQCHV